MSPAKTENKAKKVDISHNNNNNLIQGSMKKEISTFRLLMFTILCVTAPCDVGL